MLSKLARFLRTYTRWLYGDLEPQELKKFGLFALVFAFTIGGYWFLAPLKDCIFLHVICAQGESLGRQIATGKWISTFCLFALLPLYFILIDRLPGHKVFYGICGFYVVGILFFALFFSKFDQGANLALKRSMAWAWYVFVETFGAFLPTLFWSFVSDHALPGEAKKGYSLIALGGVLGGILGALVVKKLVISLGTSNLMLLSAAWVFCIPLLILLTVRSLGDKGLRGYKCRERLPRPGFWEGVRLLFNNKYLLAIFAAIAFNEITQVLIDVHFKTYAQQMFGSADSLAHFFSFYAQCINGLALVCLILRIDLFGKWLGVKKSLVILPIFVGLGIILILLVPGLYTSFIAIVATKAFNFAFNQPSKEQLYIPTTPTSKYKSKAWIDIFGYQLARSTGWGIVGYQGAVSPKTFLLLSSSIGVCLVMFWIYIAFYAGGKYQKAVNNKEIIC